MEIREPIPTSKVSMSNCVNFVEKNCIVEGFQELIKVYSKCKDTDINDIKAIRIVKSMDDNLPKFALS